MAQIVPIQKSRQQVARPLKVLIPLIQGELQLGNIAGYEHYRQAGDMLIEAKDQVAHGAFGKWLAKNFDLSQETARRYMRWARLYNENGRPVTDMPTSLRDMDGDRERDRKNRQSKQQQAFREVLRDVARDDFVQERQTHNNEIQLHRDLAEEMIDVGYRALATRLHPDRGGSKDAMSRLNRVRDELRQLAKTRRFV